MSHCGGGFVGGNGPGRGSACSGGGCGGDRSLGCASGERRRLAGLRGTAGMAGMAFCDGGRPECRDLISCACAADVSSTTFFGCCIITSGTSTITSGTFSGASTGGTAFSCPGKGTRPNFFPFWTFSFASSSSASFDSSSSTWTPTDGSNIGSCIIGTFGAAFTGQDSIFLVTSSCQSKGTGPSLRSSPFWMFSSSASS